MRTGLPGETPIGNSLILPFLKDLLEKSTHENHQ